MGEGTIDVQTPGHHAITQLLPDHCEALSLIQQQLMKSLRAQSNMPLKDRMKASSAHNGGCDPRHCLEYYQVVTGLYLASAGLDDQLVIWDLHLKSKLASQELPGGPTSLEWKPEGNAVLCSTNVGKLFLWEGCVPKGNRGPIEAADSPVKRGFQVLSQSGETVKGLAGNGAGGHPRAGKEVLVQEQSPDQGAPPLLAEFVFQGSVACTWTQYQRLCKP